ncbi:glycerophosphoryl diester phosphodiesterase [Fusarium longipes]|uniref:Glycerophosphoryl diester phosphodiesterase n=1 Tax=Fusarium longipes TaxID=694270 RepID=A0A395RH03_9HYPO|nr:glycerophosphoryl diester phosphodiesterase [Fusarium longipes]
MTAERQAHTRKDAQSAAVPQAPWAVARPSLRDPSRRLPQAIAHRGAKVDWPENTMAAFRGAIAAGAHAIETDVHISSDGIAVISHDPSLKRCFGVDARIAECSWEYLSTLRTVADPHEPMPRLKDFLELLTEPGLETIWAVLDIKLNDNPIDLVTAIARALDSVQGPLPWDQRIVLGCWNASFLQAARGQLPTYPLAHISASLLYSHHFLKIPNLGFNLNQNTLVGPSGKLILRELQRTDKLLMTWTVNQPRRMEWCIRQNLGHLRLPNRNVQGSPLIDGVITDDPRLYLEVCQKFEDEMDGKLVRSDLSLAQKVKSKAETVAFVLVTQALMIVYHVVRRMQGKFDFLKDRRTLDRP